MTANFIGVDGGGTKTKAALVDAEGRILKSAEGGSINYNNIGAEKAFLNFQEILKSVNIDYASVKAISIGDPALDDICINPHTEQFVCNIRKNLPIAPYTEIFMKSDVFMALYGLTQGKTGVLIVSGTGSMGAAIDAAGGYHVAGGWGFPVSDTGSGYDISVEAFQYIYRFFDRYGEQNCKIDQEPLAASALEYYGVSHPRELIRCFHGEHSSRAKVAEFSKIVYYCAQNGSTEAVRILENAGKRLADCAICLIGKIYSLPSAKPIVGIYGSVLTKNHIVKENFTSHVIRAYPHTEIKELKTPPEYAAAIYARQEIEKNGQEGNHVALYR